MQVQKSLLITLPTYSDDIAAYCMSNADDSDMTKDPNSLVTMITFMRSGTEAVCTLNKHTSRFLDPEKRKEKIYSRTAITVPFFLSRSYHISFSFWMLTFEMSAILISLFCRIR